MSPYDMNPLDEEQERKRREAAAMADEAVASGGGAPATPSFFESVGQGISNRFNNAITQAGNTLMNPGQVIQQRMMNDQTQQRQEDQANTEVQTNTTTTYGDGSQERTVKTQVPAQQAQPQQQPRQQAPMGPTMGPVAPNSPEAQQQSQQFAQQMARYQQPQAQTRNLAQQQPVQQRPMGQMPAINYNLGTGQAQPGIRMPQMASPQAGQLAAAPGSSLAQLGQALGRPTPYTPTAEREVAQPALWVQAANDAGTDFYKLLDVANKNPESRSIIADKIKQSFKSQTMKDEADEVMKAAQSGDLKAQNKILQSIKPESGKPREEVTVNDYLKAVLYQRLGLDELAKAQQLKILGRETKFGQITLGGANWSTESDANGNIIRAKDNEGNIATESTLNQLRAGGQKFGSQAFGFTGEANVIPVGQADAGQEYRTRTNNISGAMEQIITTGPNAGKPYGGPPGAAKSVGTSYSKALNDAFIKFQTAPTTEMAKKMMEIAGQVDSGDGRTIAAVNARINQMSPGIFNQISSGQAGSPPAPTNVGGAAPDANAVARIDRSLAENEREIARATKSTAVDPARKAQQLQVLNDERNKLLAARQSVGQAPAQGGGVVGGGSLGSQLATQSKVAGEVGEDLGKVKVNQGKTEQNADYLITKIDQLVAHPGFETSVGRKGISYAFGMTNQPLFEGTDASSWQVRFKEVQGQSFLQAIENLRGLGALSNLEGETATKAIQRMSTSQSEKEFREAANDFNDIIKRGVDRNRAKLGQPPLYGTKLASETAKQTENKPSKLSAEDRKAVEWARQNPDDPRSAQIKQRLGL